MKYTELTHHLEVRAAGREDHLVRLAALTVAGNRDVSEGLLVPKVLDQMNTVPLN